MLTTVMYLTPQTSREWLEQDNALRALYPEEALHTNRTIRPNRVEFFKQLYERGEWKLTHQSIAFTKHMVRLDGQHRLTFISKLPENTVVPVNVSFDCDPASYIAIDRGAGRSAADVLGISTGLAAVATTFAAIHLSIGKSKVSPAQVAIYAAWAKPEYDKMWAHCSYTSKIWGSAAVRCAAIYQMKRTHDDDFVLLSYASLHKADFDTMPHGSQALMQQNIRGVLSSVRGGFDLFCRAVRAFDPKQQQKIKAIAVHNVPAAVAVVRSFIDKSLP